MRYAHLSAGFMLTSIIGFLVSVFFVWKYTISWGFTFALFFAIMFVASVVSMTKADFTDKEVQQELAIHEKPLYKRQKHHIFK
jgi:preprotein translocase subunit SecF